MPKPLKKRMALLRVRRHEPTPEPPEPARRQNPPPPGGRTPPPRAQEKRAGTGGRLTRQRNGDSTRASGGTARGRNPARRRTSAGGRREQKRRRARKAKPREAGSRGGGNAAFTAQRDRSPRRWRATRSEATGARAARSAAASVRGCPLPPDQFRAPAGAEPMSDRTGKTPPSPPRSERSGAAIAALPIGAGGRKGGLPRWRGGNEGAAKAAPAQRRETGRPVERRDSIGRGGELRAGRRGWRRPAGTRRSGAQRNPAGRRTSGRGVGRAQRRFAAPPLPFAHRFAADRRALCLFNRLCWIGVGSFTVGFFGDRVLGSALPDPPWLIDVCTDLLELCLHLLFFR